MATKLEGRGGGEGLIVAGPLNKELFAASLSLGPFYIVSYHDQELFCNFNNKFNTVIVKLTSINQSIKFIHKKI